MKAMATMAPALAVPIAATSAVAAIGGYAFSGMSQAERFETYKVALMGANVAYQFSALGLQAVNHMADNMMSHAENYAIARMGNDNVNKVISLLNRPHERTPIPPSAIQAIMDQVDAGESAKIPLAIANGSPQQIDEVQRDISALHDMYARFPDREAFNELLRMYMQQMRQAAAQMNADPHIEFLPQRPKTPSFFMRGSATPLAIEDQMAEAQRAEFGTPAAPLGDPTVYVPGGESMSIGERRKQMEAAFHQGAFRQPLALPMSAQQAGMLRARENQFARAYNTNVPVGAMKTDPRGAAYRRIARY